MPAPRYLLRRYPSLLVRGTSRPRDSTHLPQHAQLVEVVPAFHYLAFIREAEDAYPGHSNRFASGSDAPELALMGAASPPAGHHHVPFGYLILDAHLYIRESVAKHASEFFDAFRAAYILRTCRIMAYKVRGEKLVCYFQVPLAARSENVKEAWA